MLQLQVKSIDICRISKLLVKYNIKANISNSTITFNSDVPDELLTQLCSDIDINAIQNFISDSTEPKPFSYTLSNNSSQYDLIYPEVKRGEVYLCDFGDPYGGEQGFDRYAIVMQNDYLNFSTTIVLPCTTNTKKYFVTHVYCTFSSRNMIDYDLERVGSKENAIITEQIRAIDKSRLRKYLGTLTPDFMKEIEEKIDITLNLSRKTKNLATQNNAYSRGKLISKIGG